MDSAAVNYAQTKNYGPPSEAAPRTLSTAMAGADELNKRLSDILNRVTGFAQAIGGPFPVQSADNAKQPAAQGAIAVLNDRTEHSHRLVTSIEELLGVVGRTLGL